MSSAGNSRSSSMSNLLEAFKISGRMSPGILKRAKDDNGQPKEPMQDDLDPDADDLNEDSDFNPNAHYNFTEKDAMGSIILSIFRELTTLANKANKNMKTNIDDICEKFHNHSLTQKRVMKNRIMQSTADWEQYMIDKELNAHSTNQVIDSPDHFSPVPTLTTPKKTAEVMKLLPNGGQKFSGAPFSTSIVEYLYNLNQMQEQCHLSVDEFYKMMLASTTGAPYMFIMNAIHDEDTPSSIYHNLLLRYDDRLQPEEARLQLYAYKVPKNITLAQAETKIQELAKLATHSLPRGPSRTASYNHEAINALFRALPVQSATLARSNFAKLSARLERSATYTEITKSLGLEAFAINADIKAHGADNRGNSNQYTNRFAKANYARKRTFPVALTYSSTANYSPLGPSANMGQPRPTWGGRPGNGRTMTGRFTSGYRPQSNQYYSNYSFPRPQFRPSGQMTRQNANFTPVASGQKGTFNNGRGGNITVGQAAVSAGPSYIQKGMMAAKKLAIAGTKMGLGQGNRNRGQRGGGNPNKDYCSLCGKHDHRAVDECPYMVNDAGRKVPIMPCKDTCPNCPPNIKVRLNHPSFICPYRKPFGPLSR